MAKPSVTFDVNYTKPSMKFSVKVTKKFNKTKVRKDIINSIEGSKEIRKEIKRVFQVANRRIQNIEKGGYFSPAVASLGKGGVEGYSKFSVKGFGNTGDEWKALVKEYSKAVAFLNQPTSTATGAKEFEIQVKNKVGVPDDIWEYVKADVIGDVTSMSDEMLQKLPYSQLTEGAYDSAYRSASSQIEKESIETAKAIQKNIEKSAKEVTDMIDNALDDLIKNWGF